MSDPLGLSIGTTNLVAARVGNQPVTRRSVLTLSSDRTPQVGVPAGSGGGVELAGFVERVGDPVPLVADDGSSYPADRLLVEALDAMIDVAGGGSPDQIAIAVPAYWSSSTQWALRNALRTNPNLAPNGVPARLVSDAVAALTALRVHPGLNPQGVVALLDLGGGGTSVTLSDASSAFEPIDETTRYTDFSGDQIDQALLTHVLAGLAAAGAVDPAATAAVGSLTRLREECRLAKERLSAETATDLTVELPGYRSSVRITRADLDALITEPFDGVLAALDTLMERNRIGWPTVSAVVTVGGGANIPLITQRLSQHSRAPVVTTPQPALDAAVGAALQAAYGAAADAPTSVAPAAPVTGIGGEQAGSATFRALAWSQDDGADEPVPYVGDNPYRAGDNPYRADDNPYRAEPVSGRAPVQQLPPTGPVDGARPWHRVPQVIVGLATIVALLAVGGVAYALTSMTTNTAPSPEVETAEPTARQVPSPTAEVPPPAPPPPAAPPPPVETVTQSVAPPPPVTVTTVAPPPTTHAPTTTTTTTTTVPTTTTTTATTAPTTTAPTTTMTTATTVPTTTVPTATAPTNPITTTYLNVPFLPPIPIQVPQNPFQPPSP